MRASRQVFFLVCLTFITLHTASGGGKNNDDDNDENSPYEFGFTIDGQQHRHEKKDVNGIIQGEFGFITADGIYHVTVYATDENGNFKILSMRNVRVSPPLDGSGTPEQKQQQSQPYKAAPQTPSQPPPATSTPSTTTTTTASKFNGFTTQSTIKPACASCGYVTTPSAAAPAKNFGFDVRGGGGSSSGLNKNVGNTQQQQQQGPLAVNVPLSESQENQGDDVDANYPGQGIPVPPQYSPDQNQGLPYQQNENDQPQTENSPNQNQIDQLPPSGESPSARLSQVSVAGGAIHVPGNPAIPIQDKYPNMRDGLPAGIDESDITDLLYKFNYTVGFHGHYEKGYRNGAKVGGYFVNGRDGISRVVTYVADENGFQPKVKLINLGLESPDTPKEDTEKSFGLKNFEFVWYPIS